MTFHLEDRIAELERLLENQGEGIDALRERIETIDATLGQLAETLTNINLYLASQGGNK